MEEKNDEDVKAAIEPGQLEQIHKALKGIVDTTAARTIDTLVYDESFEPANYKLIEVTDALAAHILDGNDFYVSGAPDDQMVLCTEDATYNAKEVERSNSMLLTNMEDVPKDIMNTDFRNFKVYSILTRNVELEKAPLFKPARLREILVSQEINIFDDEPVFPDKSMRLKEIYSALPLSEQQAQTLLDTYPVFELNGYIYCLSIQGREELMKDFAYFLGNCDVDRVRKSDLTELDVFAVTKRRYPYQLTDSIVEWMLRMFFDPADDGATHKLNRRRIVREVSTHILRRYAAIKFIGIDEMEKHFYRIMPTSIDFNVNYLQGIAFIKKMISGESVLKYFNSEELSLNDRERLKQLFEMSSTWSLDDIEPYILDFVDSKGVYEFLSKRCRSGMHAGKTIFYAA